MHLCSVARVDGEVAVWPSLLQVELRRASEKESASREVLLERLQEAENERQDKEAKVRCMAPH